MPFSSEGATIASEAQGMFRCFRRPNPRFDPPDSERITAPSS